MKISWNSDWLWQFEKLALVFLVSGTTQACQAQSTDNFNPGAPGGVLGMAMQPDGQIILGGVFSRLAGEEHNLLGRVNAEGTLDATFNPVIVGYPYPPSYVLALALQTDTRILIGGAFTWVNGEPRVGLARLHRDGTLDHSFNTTAGGGAPWVYGFAVQEDGRILVGGAFTTLGGQIRDHIARLQTDGSIELEFDPRANGSVRVMALQPGGKIVVGGSFTRMGGQPRAYIARLNPDGTLDSGFNPGANASVYSMIIQTDSKILVGGEFTTLGGQSCARIGRLNPDGTVDTGFNPGADSTVLTLALQADGKILAGGIFTTLGGQLCGFLGRLNPDGTVDSGLNAGADLPVNALAIQADGKILAGGGFSILGEQARAGIGRLNNTHPATEKQSYNDSVITWLRGGTSPEVWRTVFDFSTDGAQWISLGPGTRIPGGWQLTGASVPPGATIRARGYVTGAQGDDSAWWVENEITLQAITPSEALAQFIDQVRASWPRSRPLVATLSAALASVQRNHALSAINQLRAFQHQVAAQVQRLDPALAADFINAAEEIIAVLNR